MTLTIELRCTMKSYTFSNSAFASSCFSSLLSPRLLAMRVKPHREQLTSIGRRLLPRRPRPRASRCNCLLLPHALQRQRLLRNSPRLTLCCRRQRFSEVWSSPHQQYHPLPFSPPLALRSRLSTAEHSTAEHSTAEHSTAVLFAGAGQSLRGFWQSLPFLRRVAAMPARAPGGGAEPLRPPA